MKGIKLSAGALSAVEGCPRCLWLDFHGYGPPGRPFPGIVQQLDSVIKDYTRRFFGQNKLPKWFNGIDGRLLECRGTLRFTDPASGVTLTGRLDDLLKRPNGHYRVIDYKSGRAAPEKTVYYQAQMDGYHWLVEKHGHFPVDDAVLLFFTPTGGTGLSRSVIDLEITPLAVETQPTRVPALLRKAKKILSRQAPPAAGPGCEWCTWIRAAQTRW